MDGCKLLMPVCQEQLHRHVPSREAEQRHKKRAQDEAKTVKLQECTTRFPHIRHAQNYTARTPPQRSRAPSLTSLKHPTPSAHCLLHPPCGGDNQVKRWFRATRHFACQPQGQVSQKGPHSSTLQAGGELGSVRLQSEGRGRRGATGSGLGS